MRNGRRRYTDQRGFGGVSNLMGEIVAVFVMTVGYT